MKKLFRRLCRGFLLSLLAGAGSEVLAAIEPVALERLRHILDDAVVVVAENYHPRRRIDGDFRRRMAAARLELEQAPTYDAGCLRIALAFYEFDPEIRLSGFDREFIADYGWNWRLIGDAAFVVHVDANSAAAQQGLRRGDRVLGVEKTTLARANHRLVGYTLRVIAPRVELPLVAQAPGEAPRGLAPAANPRRWPGPAAVSLARAAGDAAATRDPRLVELLDWHRQVRRLGGVQVWRATHLGQSVAAVSEIVEAARGARQLIIDLRGVHGFRHDTVLEVLSRLLPGRVAVGRIERRGRDVRLTTRPDADPFRGEVVVLVDADTGGYAEVLARVVQQQRRGPVIGDRTRGVVREEALAWAKTTYESPVKVIYEISAPVGNAPHRTIKTSQTIPGNIVNGTKRLALAEFAFDPLRFQAIQGVRLPVGRVVLADGTDLHGVGVTPDVTLLPTGTDLAGKRDVVLAHALALLGETVTPEDAYQLFRNDWDDDEFILDQTALY